jgi:hypothetical protein
MQHPTPDSGTREPDTGTTAAAAAAGEARQRAERHRAIGIAAVAAALLFQGPDDPLRASTASR